MALGVDVGNNCNINDNVVLAMVWIANGVLVMVLIEDVLTLLLMMLIKFLPVTCWRFKCCCYCC